MHGVKELRLSLVKLRKYDLNYMDHVRLPFSSMEVRDEIY